MVDLSASAPSYRDRIAPPLMRRGPFALQPGKGSGMDEAMAMLAFTVVPLDLAIMQPIRMPVTLLLICYAVLHWRSVVPMAWQGRWFFLLPALCLLSALWSAQASAALWYGGLMVVTIGIGALLAARLDHRQLAVALLLSQGVLAVISLADMSVTWVGGIDGGYAAIGIFPHKNVLGQRMVFLTLAGIAMLVSSGYRPLWRLVAVGLIPVALMLIARSLSATAVILLVGAVPLSLGVALLWRPAAKRPGGRAAIVFAGITLAASALLVMVNVFGFNPLTDILGVLGKDSTLTGRTDLWLVGAQSMEDHPLLGVGAGNFWQVDTYAASRLAGRFGTSTDTFTFHNGWVEVMVHLGAVGLVAAIGTWGAGLWMIIRQWLHRQADADPLYLSLAAVFFVRSFAESEMFSPVAFGPLVFWMMVFGAMQSRRQGQEATTP